MRFRTPAPLGAAFVIVLFTCALAPVRGAQAPPLKIVADLALPRPHWSTPGGVQPGLRIAGPAAGGFFLARATDIRWDDDGHVLVAGLGDGTLRLPIDAADRAPLERAYPALANAGASGIHMFMGSSAEYLLGAAPFHLMSWVPRALPNGSRPVSTEAGFDTILDLDVSGDRLLVIGLRRGEGGKVASDAAIAWRAKLGRQLSELQPVQFSLSGPGARDIDACADMQMSKVRFLADRSFVVVPGAEPGIFLYDAGGKLIRTFPADLVGFDAGCPITQEQMFRFGVDVPARYRWKTGRRVLDEVLPIGNAVGFLVRTRDKDVTRWQLKVLSREGKVTAYEVPVTSPSEYARLAGDSHGRRLALLLNLDPLDTPPPGSNHVIIAELPELPPS